jgi:hypothetical protein
MPSGTLTCDGCGQPADPEHFGRRLKRLENMTRYRPIHVQALFLGAASPARDEDYLYSASGKFRGEALALLRALAIESEGRTVESALAEFQRRGYLLGYVLECPFIGESLPQMLTERMEATAARIRRSLKPKSLVVLGPELQRFGDRFEAKSTGAELVVIAADKGLGSGATRPGLLEAALNGRF